MMSFKCGEESAHSSWITKQALFSVNSISTRDSSLQFFFPTRLSKKYKLESKDVSFQTLHRKLLCPGNNHQVSSFCKNVQASSPSLFIGKPNFFAICSHISITAITSAFPLPRFLLPYMCPFACGDAPDA